jgi:hypothetical protein
MANDVASEQRNENKKLSVFIGTWHTTGNIYGDDGTISGKLDATDTYEWLPGNYAVIHYVDSTMGNVKMQGIEIIGYDPLKKIFLAPFFDNQGSAGSEEITANGNEWIWRGENVMGVNHHRCTAVFKNDKTIEAKHEHSADGKLWNLWMDIVLRRKNVE